MFNIFGRILEFREDSLQIVMRCRPFYRTKNQLKSAILPFLRDFLLLIFSTKNHVSMMPNKLLLKHLKINMMTDEVDRLQKVFPTAKKYTHKLSILMFISAI